MTYNAGKLGSQEWWPAYNRSGSKIDAASIVKITDLKVVDDRFYLEVDECDSAANFILGVTGPQLDMASSAYGDVRPLGNVFYCKYDTGDGTPANEENWGADNGTSLLKKNFGGGQYAVIGSDSDSELAVVMHTGAVTFRGEADEDITLNSTGTINILVGQTAGETDSGDNVEATNVGSDVQDGDYVILHRFGSGWVFTAEIQTDTTLKLGKTDADHDVDTSGTVSVWSGTPGSETDTTDNITAYNRFADVASDSWVWCANNGDGWYIVAARCG